MNLAIVSEEISAACHTLDNMWGHHQDGSDLRVDENELFHIVFNDVLKRLKKANRELHGIEASYSSGQCLGCGIPKRNGCQCRNHHPKPLEL
jgi:hypothetical protein